MALADHLGNVRVLAPLAAKVTARRGDGVGGGAGVKVHERFLLHRVHVLGDSPPVDQRVQRPALVLPYLADAQLAIGDCATVGAQVAAHPLIRQLFVEHSLFHPFSLL